jgi:glycosyltransferase involved in cell wall biosynthesis
MRVFLDLTPLSTVSTLRGIGRYVRGLVQGLGELPAAELNGTEIIGLAADDRVTHLSRVTDLAARCAQPASTPSSGAGWRRDWLLSIAAPRMVGSAGLLHLSEPKGYPFPRSVPVTTTSHDLIALALPDLYLPPIPHWARWLKAKEQLRFAHYRGVIAVSRATQRDVCQMLGLSPDLVHVVEHGVDHARFRAEPAPGDNDDQAVAQLLGDAQEPYILYLGASDARKDLETLVRAYAQSKARSAAKLVLAGRHDRHRIKTLSALIDQLGVRDRVVRPGYVSESIVPAVYRRARVHAFVSRYEGFGLPVLEALACGTPTITSPGSSLDEVAGDAARVVPCGDSEALQVEIDRLFFDNTQHAEMRARGLRRAHEFTWAECARKTLRFFAAFS